MLCKGVTQLNRGGPGPVAGNGVSAGSESHRFAPVDELRGPSVAAQKLLLRSGKDVKEWWRKGQWRKKAVLILKISLSRGPTDGEFAVKWLL